MATPKIIGTPLGGIPVPPTRSSIYYKIDGEWVAAAPNEKDLLLRDEDVPTATGKRMSFTLDPANWHQVAITVTKASGIQETTYYAPETNVSDKSPNYLRNEFDGKFPAYVVHLVAPPAPATPPPT